MRDEPYVIEGGMRDWPAPGKWSPRFLAEHGREHPVSVTFGNCEQRPTDVRPSTLGAFVDQYCGDGATAPDDHRDAVPHLQLLDLLQAFPSLNDDLPFESLFPRWCTTRRFSWMGVAGATTGLHNDGVHNFHAQIYGEKHFLLSRALPRHLVSSKYDFRTELSRVDLLSDDFRDAPFYRDLRPTISEVTLRPGDLLFIPKWWWHQVRSLNTTISANCFMIFAADLAPSIYHLMLTGLHRMRLYKHGNCVCHSA